MDVAESGAAGFNADGKGDAALGRAVVDGYYTIVGSRIGR